ncbi:cbb3-type cytochrome c oxidase subunit I, partial [bacterium]|nr:cbb3-type cytochrome c oxidase subunit I [bacterium]
MIFLFIIPSIPASFGNFFLPLMIGARDVAFPRLNLLSWYCYIVGAVLAVTALFTGGGPPDTGWTFYAPYSTQTGTNVGLAVFAAFVIGMSSILTGINFVVTIHRLRAPGMTAFRMPLFVWSLYATSWVQIIATPIVGITLLLIIFDRLFGVGLFDPTKGGDPLLYQHLFWIYSHPAVYIMILPALGVVSEIIPTFSQKRIFGYRFIAFSSIAIAALGSLVWGHHMFTTGISDFSRITFSVLTFFVAIPSAIKVFNWVSTLYGGSIDLRPPLLFCIYFIFLFMIGGLTGMLLASLGPNLHTHDTYFVVGHFHYVMFGGAVMVFFASLHYWFPKMFGRMYNEKIAHVAATIIFIGFNILYFSMLVVGYMGMPRRYYDYLPRFHLLNFIATVGSWILIFGILLMFYNLARALFYGKPAPANPWHGATLEWKTPSPPPTENFEEIPVVNHQPYDYEALRSAREDDTQGKGLA